VTEETRRVTDLLPMSELKRIHAALSGLAVSMFAFVSTVQADSAISTTLSGFGTVGGSLTSDGEYQYRHDSTEFSGAPNSFDVGLDSRLGVQQWWISATAFRSRHRK